MAWLDSMFGASMCVTAVVLTTAYIPIYHVNTSQSYTCHRLHKLTGIGFYGCRRVKWPGLPSEPPAFSTIYLGLERGRCAFICPMYTQGQFSCLNTDLGLIKLSSSDYHHPWIETLSLQFSETAPRTSSNGNTLEVF